VMLVLLFTTVLPQTATAAEGEISVERGKQVSITHACHDCHTAGYIESDGKLDPAAALKGSPMGWRGPWGTTYALNLRLTVAEKAKTEDEFVQFAKTFKTRPPMPWYNVHAMDESDLGSLFQYIKSLGEPGEQAPQPLVRARSRRPPTICFSRPCRRAERAEPHSPPRNASAVPISVLMPMRMASSSMANLGWCRG
jgi:mono/diheme cytochrome c family protein